MPQIAKGGKFVFGWSRVREDGGVCLPAQAVAEYAIASEGRAILFTGSKSTGGFCITRKGLWLPSKLGFLLDGMPELADYTIPAWTWVRCKGRSYCWAPITEDGALTIVPETLSFLRIARGDDLLSIRSSDIAFTMGHHGPLIQRARAYEGTIDVY